MKLLTHNMITTKFLKDINVGYPVRLTATEIRITPVDFNMEFVKRILPRIQYDVLRETAYGIGHGNNLPETLPPPQHLNDEDLLKKIHRVLLETDIITGELTCPESDRKFRISNGVADMLVSYSDMSVNDDI